jgi:alpha-D-xyloside xylohydrolase
MIDKGYMLGNMSTYNAFDENARRNIGSKPHAGFFPADLMPGGAIVLNPSRVMEGHYQAEPEARIAINCDEARRYLDPTQINAYSLLHSEGIYSGQRAETSDKRVINLTRSSYAGQHRYATITWSVIPRRPGNV